MSGTPPQAQAATLSWTVVVPTYRRPGSLARCLTALTALEAPGGLEVLVVDDGGPEGEAAAVAAAVVAEVSAGGPDAAPRIIVHRQANAGPAAARNAGAARARSELLAFTDDDCVPHPGWLSALAPHLRGADVLVGGRTINARASDLCAEATQTMVSHLVEPRAGQQPTFLPTCNLALRTASFAGDGSFDERFPRAAGEDRAFCDAWRAAGRGMAYAPGALVDHHHALTLRSFWRQHRAYGQASATVHEMRAAAGMADAGRAPLTFYLGLLLRPLREQTPVRAVPVAGLVALSQVATVAGRLRG